MALMPGGERYPKEIQRVLDGYAHRTGYTTSVSYSSGGGASISYSYVTGEDVKLNQYDRLTISMENLKELQRLAAQHGLPLQINQGDRTIVPAPPVSAGKIPDDVKILSEKRIGDEIKDRYLDHLREMFAQGFLSESEYDARQKHIMEAQGKAALDLMIADLPAMSMPQIPAAPEPAEKRHLYGTEKLVTSGLFFGAALYSPLTSVSSIIFTAFCVAIAIVFFGLFVRDWKRN